MDTFTMLGAGLKKKAKTLKKKTDGWAIKLQVEFAKTTALAV